MGIPLPPRVVATYGRSHPKVPVQTYAATNRGGLASAEPPTQSVHTRERLAPRPEGWAAMGVHDHVHGSWYIQYPGYSAFDDGRPRGHQRPNRGNDAGAGVAARTGRGRRRLTAGDRPRWRATSPASMGRRPRRGGAVAVCAGGGTCRPASQHRYSIPPPAPRPPSLPPGPSARIIPATPSTQEGRPRCACRVESKAGTARPAGALVLSASYEADLDTRLSPPLSRAPAHPPRPPPRPVPPTQPSLPWCPLAGAFRRWRRR